MYEKNVYNINKQIKPAQWYFLSINVKSVEVFEF